MGRNAVPLLARDRLALRSLRPASDDPHLDSGTGDRLDAYGASAQPVVARARSDPRRDHVIEFHHDLRLYGRYHRAREACARLAVAALCVAMRKGVRLPRQLVVRRTGGGGVRNEQVHAPEGFP